MSYAQPLYDSINAAREASDSRAIESGVLSIREQAQAERAESREDMVRKADCLLSQMLEFNRLYLKSFAALFSSDEDDALGLAVKLEMAGEVLLEGLK